MDSRLNRVCIGVTGHRRLGDDPRVGWYVQAECTRILACISELSHYQRASLTAHSALATGADQLFAQAALGLGIPLVGVLPYEGYIEDFEGEDREYFERLLSLCSEVHRLPHHFRSNEAYMDSGKWVADHVEYLLAIWDGETAKGFGGTADVVTYAQQQGRTLLFIDPTQAVRS